VSSPPGQEPAQRRGRLGPAGFGRRAAEALEHCPAGGVGGGVPAEQLGAEGTEVFRDAGHRLVRRGRVEALLIAQDLERATAEGQLASQDLVQTGEHHRHGLGQPGRAAAFVPHPGGRREDDGWLLGSVYDHACAPSELAVLDTGDLAAPPVARVLLSARVPLGLHAIWIPEAALGGASDERTRSPRPDGRGCRAHLPAQASDPGAGLNARKSAGVGPPRSPE
jgi:hypothetical protein